MSGGPGELRDVIPLSRTVSRPLPLALTYPKPRPMSRETYMPTSNLLRPLINTPETIIFHAIIILGIAGLF